MSSSSKYSENVYTVKQFERAKETENTESIAKYSIDVLSNKTVSLAKKGITQAATDYFKSQENLRKIIKLANLSLSPEEEDKYGEQLSKILEYIEQLNQVETSNVEPTFNVSGNSNVMRKDETVASLSQEEALSNAPAKKDGMFVTKGVFENE